MDGLGALFFTMDFAAREAALFAAAGFLLLGASDLLVDILWITHSIRRTRRRLPSACAATLARPAVPGRIIVFIPAWQEDAVIGRMLEASLERIAHDDYRLYVGCYPNDSATIAAVHAIDDARVRLVIGEAPGPTTKADCLNTLWRALIADEAAAGFIAKAVVLHDAEDVVHSAELRVFDTLIERFDMVQLPVLPLIDRDSRWIAGHYADEFAEAHGKELVVREMLGAALPSAGVGCAFARGALAEIAGDTGPFDPSCLTEDYEVGLRLHAAGRRAVFVRLPGLASGPVVVTREYFPATIDAAVAQKARWMVGIALAGWDRLGWSGGWAERWMRLRDRQSVLAAVLLVAGYFALLAFVALHLATLAGLYQPAPLPRTLRTLFEVSLAMLGWRLAMRSLFVGRAYGWKEALRAPPRVVVSNIIAMMAARRALAGYLGIRRTGTVRWDKTRHAFPQVLPAE